MAKAMAEAAWTRASLRKTRVIIAPLAALGPSDAPGSIGPTHQ